MRLSHAPVTFVVMILISVAFLAEAAHAIPAIIAHPNLGIGALFAATKSGFVLERMGAIIPGTIQDPHQWWRLVAATFLHAGILHVALNMWALFQLGYVFERMFGSSRFALTYFVSGIAASFASAITATDNSSVGASGAIFGILGALIFAIRRSPFWREQPWAKSLGRQLIGWAAVNVAIGFIVPNIDNAAHIGGFLAGLLLGFLPHKVPPPPPREVIIDAAPIDRIDPPR